MSNGPLEGVRLTQRGLALCHFLFRDAPTAGLSEKDANEIGMRLIDQWDGTETLLQMYQRMEQWPDEVDVGEKLLENP